MKASVVINIHGGTQLEQFERAADSVLDQRHDDVEFVVVVSDAPEHLEHVERRYGDAGDVQIVALETDDGLSAARNAGAEAATGEVVAFTDDDVVAERDWITELLEMYDAHDPAGVGGHVVPSWPGEEPWYLPSEFYWLVGVMYDNFVDSFEPQPVRNTFGCNISFRRPAFLEAGSFREDLGKNQTVPLQGEEAELCERVDGEFWFAPAAVVHHEVNEEQLSMRYLFRRSFWQGYSKAALAEDMGDESSFLAYLFTEGLPRRLRKPTPKRLGAAATLLGLTATVGFGYLYGRMRARR